jgi:hypothetical protein
MKEDEMDGAFSTHGREKLNRRDHLKEVDVDGRIMDLRNCILDSASLS